MEKRKWLLPAVRGKYLHNTPTARLSWFKAGGVASVLYLPEDADDLADFLRAVDDAIPLCVVGAGSNMFVRSSGFEGILVKLPSAPVTYADGLLTAGAGTLDHSVAKAALQHGIGGLEFFVGIPGTIGGAVAMNAGCYGRELKDVFVDGRFLDRKGNKVSLNNSEMQFGYRTSPLMADLIALEVRLQGYSDDSAVIQEKMLAVQSKRRATQPIGKMTCGSTFRNPAGHSAWKLIEDAGCAGLSVGGASVSEKHCNFMINDGAATAEDIEQLMNLVAERVWQAFAVKLEREVRIL